MNVEWRSAIATVALQDGFEKRLDFDDSALARELFGPQNQHLKLIAQASGARIDSRGNMVILRSGSQSELEHAHSTLTQLYGLLKQGLPVYPADVERALLVLAKEPGTNLVQALGEEAIIVSPKRSVKPKTANQSLYLSAMAQNDLVFCIGPAGTGKTYLAVAAAVSALLSRKVRRLVLTRPAVEAGEKLGFLPGDLQEKINPYLRPLYDALHDLLDFRRVKEMIETEVIEIAPLAFMRGRTLNDAFVILDEAQNTTPEQMKMFLTRLGFGSKAVVTGDVTQVDLPSGAESGLSSAERILNGVSGLSIVHLKEEDVVRHPLVARIVQAYERHFRSSKQA